VIKYLYSNNLMVLNIISYLQARVTAIFPVYTRSSNDPYR